MTSVDKAAMAWTIGIVAVAIGIVGAISQPDSPSVPIQQMAPQTTMQSEPQVMEEELEVVEEPTMIEEEVEEEELTEILVEEPEMVPELSGPVTVEVSLPVGSAVPGCEDTNQCFIPDSVSINAGDTVVWANDDTAAHTVTSGSPATGPDAVFDSSLFMAGTIYSNTFDDAGEYPYFCMVHPWMIGNVSVS